MPIVLAENSVVAGRFRLNRMIGRGGMGSVWHATHLGLDIPCAVKFMEGEFSKSAEAQARFEREAKAAAQLRSPHVVQVLDHGVCEGTPYIAMELLDGEDLGKRLQKTGVMHPRDLNVIITQVCRALTKAHALGIVHRDLKPDNIFLVLDDDREIAKVLDFGIAKSAVSALEGSNTKTGAMLGTPYYMSPEQAQGVKSVDYRSDLWSLGVIVYQCVTGRLPFESEALGDLLMKIIVQPLPVPSQFADVSAGFDAWWARASSRDPAGRFQSAKEFAESLGMVFGASQATDVMDRGQIRGVLGQTPQPGIQRPMMLTPVQASSQALPAGGTTGAPIARTFADGAPVVPAKKTGAIIGASIAVVLVLGVGIAGLAMRKGSAANASAPPPPAVLEAPVANAAAAAPVVPAPPPVVTVAPPATPPAETAAASPAPSPAAAAEPPKSSSHHSTPKPAPPPPAAAPAPPKVATPDKPKPPAPKAPGDLGF